MERWMYLTYRLTQHFITKSRDYTGEKTKAVVRQRGTVYLSLCMPYGEGGR